MMSVAPVEKKMIRAHSASQIHCFISNNTPQFITHQVMSAATTAFSERLRFFSLNKNQEVMPRQSTY